MFDLIVLGGGPGGYLAADRAGSAGLSVLLIEKNKLGGVCLNEGCIPSKTFLHSAKVFDHAARGEVFGVFTENPRLDQAAVVARKNKVVRTLVAGVGQTLKSSKVTVKNGTGIILGRENRQIRVQCGEEVFTSRHLIIATGSEAVIPPIDGVKEGLESKSVLTNREILDLQVIPEHLVVIGGGVIGLEMAGYFRTCGSQVTVVEMLDHIAGAADREMADLLQKDYERKGIEFHLNCQVTNIKPGSVEFTDSGETKSVDADYTLLSVGRRPVVRGFGLENLGVLVEGGRIVTDAQGRTNVSGVFAVGDVNGVWMLAHAAYREAEVAVNTILGKKDFMRYQAMPSVIYTNPEMAFVGETEQTCQDKGIKYKKVTLPMNYSGRYLAENDRGQGRIKLLIDSDREYLLGCHVIGSYASEIIMSAGILIETQMRIADIKELIFPHPTVAEIIREAVFQV
ncbi:MAG: dihydrolipoyl dehydrogenase [Saccharofermentanales bacterium]|jgi:dihydrolipoamide dehydrogenase|nr:dihydrolipoyl dehydrogenase [Clostridiaceae bacterium]